MPYYMQKQAGELIGPLTLQIVPGHGPVVPAGAVELPELPELPDPRQGHVWVYHDGQAVELLDSRGTYYRTTTGERVEHTELGELPEGLTTEPRPGPFHVWQDNAWTLDTEAERRARVPPSILMRQARLCLRRNGLLSAVQPAIDALPEPDRTDAQIEWDHSGAVERDRGFVLQIAQALGISDEQLDALFIEAATL
jgi:hypothetical protein